MASKAVKTGLLSALAVLMAVGMTINTTQYAMAATSITCVDTVSGSDVTDVAPLALGTSVSCTSSTGNPAVVAHEVTVFDGTGAVAVGPIVGAGGVIAPVAFVTINAGVWHVQVLYFDAAGLVVGVELVNIIVSFLVIPESPIGVAALIGTSLAALGAFIGIRSRKVAVPA